MVGHDESRPGITSQSVNNWHQSHQTVSRRLSLSTVTIDCQQPSDQISSKQPEASRCLPMSQHDKSNAQASVDQPVESHESTSHKHIFSTGSCRARFRRAAGGASLPIKKRAITVVTIDDKEDDEEDMSPRKCFRMAKPAWVRTTQSEAVDIITIKEDDDCVSVVENLRRNKMHLIEEPSTSTSHEQVEATDKEVENKIVEDKETKEKTVSFSSEDKKVEYKEAEDKKVEYKEAEDKKVEDKEVEETSPSPVDKEPTKETIVISVPDEITPTMVPSCDRCRCFDTDFYNNMTSTDFGLDHRAHINNVYLAVLDERMRFFVQAVEANKKLLENKVVLNYPCGVGLFALMSARAGARLVIGVDPSNIICLAKNLLDNNKEGDRVQLIQGKIEDISLPVDQVDVILGDWLGHSLLNSFIPEMIAARDKFLSPDGRIFPQLARLMMIGVGDVDMNDTRPLAKRSKSIYSRTYKFWDDVYGFKMEAIKSTVRKEPCFFRLKKHNQITEPVQLKTIDMKTVTADEMKNCRVEFEMRAKNDDYITMMALFYEVEFACDGDKKDKLSTAPRPIQKNVDAFAQGEEVLKGALKTDKREETAKIGWLKKKEKEGEKSDEKEDYPYRQQVFFLDEGSNLVVKKGDKIRGHFEWHLDGDKNRFATEIGLNFDNGLCRVDRVLSYLHPENDKNFV